MSIKCKECGKEIPEDVALCPYCEAPVITEADFNEAQLPFIVEYGIPAGLIVGMVAIGLIILWILG